MDDTKIFKEWYEFSEDEYLKMERLLRKENKMERRRFKKGNKKWIMAKIFYIKKKGMANNMKKLYMNKEDRKIIESHMTRKTRKEYKNGSHVTITIKRNKPLRRYGETMIIKIGKCGRIYDCNLEEDINNVAKNIISYFIYGEYKYDFVICS